MAACILNRCTQSAEQLSDCPVNIWNILHRVYSLFLSERNSQAETTVFFEAERHAACGDGWLEVKVVCSCTFVAYLGTVQPLINLCHLARRKLTVS